MKRKIEQGGNNVRKWKNKGPVDHDVVPTDDLFADVPIDLTHASFTFYTLMSFKNAFLVDTQMDVPKKQLGVIGAMRRWFKPQATESINERVWTKLRLDGYDDEEIWRRLVPLPGACLGVIINERGTA